MARKPQGPGPIDDDGTLIDYYKRRREQRLAREDEREAQGLPRRRPVHSKYDEREKPEKPNG